MNWVRNCILFSSLTIFAGFAFAEVNCPPTPIVTNLKFLHADGAQGIWDLFSETFTYDNKNWQVIFTVYLPDATNNEAAIQLGEDFYRTRIEFFDPPMGRSNEHRQTCYYAQQDSTYFVRAISNISNL